MLRILHTSDWHLGRQLKSHNRYNEFTNFLNWLEITIKTRNIDALIISGDIFDNSTPTVQAQTLYYSFLNKLADTHCRHTVIISGNHDSPSFLDAPSGILKRNNIHVTGLASHNPCDEVLTLSDKNGTPELIVCAVPYLRDRDVRTVSRDTSPDDTERALTAGIRSHYAQVLEHARKLQGDSDIPVIAMGHMFIRGGHTRPDDGTRQLYVGTALQINADIFPDWLTYTALGHLHSPQKCGRENIRYSGSPIPMGFGESGQKKSVCIVELEGRECTGIEEVEVPLFQRIERVNGDYGQIFSQLEILAAQNVSVWCDVTYTGEGTASGLHDRIQEFTKAFPLVEVLSVHDEGTSGVIISEGKRISLENIKPLEMLTLCYDSNKTPDDKREILTPLYKEIMHKLEVD